MLKKKNKQEENSFRKDAFKMSKSIAWKLKQDSALSKPLLIFVAKKTVLDSQLKRLNKITFKPNSRPIIQLKTKLARFTSLRRHRLVTSFNKQQRPTAGVWMQLWLRLLILIKNLKNLKSKKTFYLIDCKTLSASLILNIKDSRILGIRINSSIPLIHSLDPIQAEEMLNLYQATALVREGVMLVASQSRRKRKMENSFKNDLL